MNEIVVTDSSDLSGQKELARVMLRHIATVDESGDCHATLLIGDEKVEFGLSFDARHQPRTLSLAAAARARAATRPMRDAGPPLALRVARVENWPQALHLAIAAVSAWRRPQLLEEALVRAAESFTNSDAWQVKFERYRMTQRPSPIIDEVSQRVDLSETGVRERLSPAASQAFLAIMERWNIGEEDARDLLGGAAGKQYDDLRNEPRRTLDADTLTRISYLVGIYKALTILYPENLAEEWIRLPNSNPIFGGQSPLAYMTKGGLPAMQTVQRLLNATREGM